MRTFFIALVSALITGLVVFGIMHHHEETRVFRVTVDAFNDGFMDGVCNDGVDGFGRPCR
ncbi:hypothetical protein [Streptomyces sp. PsTaAH-124]|uniref:hypothetical protein n=1 Tax=Streptomyces sp. PsTaAH-124 TaxID=1157638 RepID=UPI00037C7B5F|nr:hypothetical protein [Streptomyces sp. PsTaAH-124]